MPVPALRGPIRPEKPTLPYNHSAFAPVCNFSTYKLLSGVAPLVAPATLFMPQKQP